MNNKTKYSINDKFFSFTFISPIKQQPEEIKALFPGKVKGWYMQCECGTYRVYEPSHIVSGRITSCGCKRGANIVAKRDHSKGNEKRKQTFLARHGVENAGQLEDRSERQINSWKNNKEQILAKRKASGSLFSSDKFKQARQDSGLTYRLADTGESLQAWYDRVQPKVSYQSIRRYAESTSILTSNNLIEASEKMRVGISNLELKFMELTGTPLWNKSSLDNASRRFDFKLTDNIYVNIDGLYVHTEERKKGIKTYHMDIRKEAEAEGKRLIQIREDELRDKPNLVLSMINNVLGRTKTKISARNLKLEHISYNEAKDFLKRCHIMGSHKSKYIGLRDANNNIQCIMGYKRKQDFIDITRFCSELDTVVRGGQSKLLKEVERLNPNKSIHYWVDLRYGTGTNLLSLGFTHIKDTLGFCWTDKVHTYNRLYCTKDSAAKEKGLLKIWDAGQRLYVKIKNPTN